MIPNRSADSGSGLPTRLPGVNRSQSGCHRTYTIDQSELGNAGCNRKLCDFFCDSANGLLRFGGFAIVPGQRTLLSHPGKLSVQLSRLSVVLLHRLPTMGPKPIFEKWVDVNGRANGMNGTQTWCQFTSDLRIDRIDVMVHLCLARRRHLRRCTGAQ